MRRAQLARGILLVSAILLVWGVLLPSLSRTETVRARDAWLEEQQIDPAAMFYTDVPHVWERVVSDPKSTSAQTTNH